MGKLLPLVVGLALFAVCGTALADGAAGGSATGGPVSQSGAPAAQLAQFSCLRDVQPRLRSLSVTGVMRPVTGTGHMRMRFDLLASARRHGRYHRVPGPNLGHWLSPDDPALGTQPDDVWRLAHPVVGLLAPAFYKLRVSFRWLDKGGHLVAHQTLVTPVCHQLELRPDLAAQSLTITPAATTGDDDYQALVRNLGATGAGPFEVQLALADGTTITRQLLWLGPHRSRQESFVAAGCTAGSTVTLTVDPQSQVDDYDRANNVLMMSCPS